MPALSKYGQDEMEYKQSSSQAIEKAAAPLPFLVWGDINERDTKVLITHSAGQKRKTLLAKLLDLPGAYGGSSTNIADPNDAQRIAVFLDLFSNVLDFCAKSKFSALKTSTFLSLVRLTHIKCCEVQGPLVTLGEAYAFFETNLLRHSVERPPFSIAVFAHPEVKALVHFMSEIYFRHLSMYQLVFGTTRQLTLNTSFSAAPTVSQVAIQSLQDAKEDAPAATAATAATPTDSSSVDTKAAAAAATADDDLTHAHPEPLLLAVPTKKERDLAVSRSSLSLNGQVEAETGRSNFGNVEDQAKFQALMDKELERLQAEFKEKLRAQEKALLRKFRDSSGKKKSRDHSRD